MFWTHRSFWILPILIGAILGSLTASVALSRLKKVYQSRFPDLRRERLFLASVGFFTTAFVVRTITIAIHHNVGPFHDVSMHGRHIHHLVWGVLLLLSVGYAWIIGLDGRFISMVYGVGAALTLDEFALWLNLRDVYWEREGRESFEALAVFGGLLAVGIFGRSFFDGAVRELGRVFRRKAAEPPSIRQG
jgi:MFS family permease